MKTSSQIIVISAVAGVVAWSVAHWQNNAGNSSVVAKKETAYERVMKTRTLRCGYALWPGQTEMEPNTKKLSGIIPDFTDKLGEKLGLKIEWTQEVLWGQQGEAFKTGKIDALCSSDGPWVTTGAGFTDYTIPMMFHPIYVYGREGEKRFHSLADLNSPQVTFSTMDGDISLAMVLERFPNAKRLELSQAADGALVHINVMTKKADLALLSPSAADAINNKQSVKLVKLFDEPIAIVNASFSVGKGEQELLQMLNQGFMILHQFGISDQLIDKVDPEHKLLLRVAKGWAQ